MQSIDMNQLTTAQQEIVVSLGGHQQMPYFTLMNIVNQDFERSYAPKAFLKIIQVLVDQDVVNKEGYDLELTHFGRLHATEIARRRRIEAERALSQGRVRVSADGLTW